MNIKYVFFAVSLGILVLVLPGCSNPDQEGFPFMFGPTQNFDPVNQPTGSGTNNVSICVQDSDAYTIYNANVDIDNGDWVEATGSYSLSAQQVGALSYGSAYFYDLPSGRHLVKVTHTDYSDKIILINLPGNGEDMEYTVYMDSTGGDNGGDNGGGDDYEDNNSSSSPYNIDSMLSYAWGYSDLSNNWCYLTDLNATIHTSEDNDYYSINLYSGEYVYIRLKNIPSGCDYDIELRDWDDNYKTGSYNDSNSDETIFSYYIISAGLYRIRIYSSSNYDSSNEYTLRVEVD